MRPAKLATFFLVAAISAGTPTVLAQPASATPQGESGTPEQQRKLADKYYSQRDYPQALHWYRKAAENGDLSAQTSLGAMYQLGSGIPIDDAEAVRWFRSAAEQGYASAQSNLGYMYRKGRGVPQDDSLALYWYRKGADQGDRVAQAMLGTIYEHGDGVSVDLLEAARWYRRAADQGVRGAQYFLGRMYEDGRGVPQDRAEATRWYRKAAEQGHTDAKLQLDNLTKPNEAAKNPNSYLSSFTRSTNGPAASSGGAFLRCRDWPRGLVEGTGESPLSETAITTHKLSYLDGIQQGYETAYNNLDGLASKLGAGPSTLSPVWSKLVVLPKSQSWERVSKSVDWFCAQEGNSEIRVVDTVRLVIEEAWKTAQDSEDILTPDERFGRAVRRSCATLDRATSVAFVHGFQDGNAYFWTMILGQLPQIMRSIADPSADDVQKTLTERGAFLRDMFSPSSAGQPINQELNSFCAKRFNQDVPVSFAVAAVVMRAKGLDSTEFESSLEPFYCKHLGPVWNQGREMKARACSGFTFLGSTPPVLDKPFGLIVSVRNDSDSAFEVDWSQWSLTWTDKKGKPRSQSALDPDKLAKSITRRSAIAAALAGFGAGLNAGMPRTATVYGPQGIQVVTVPAPPGAAAAATSQAAEPYIQAGSTMSDTVYQVSLRRTTLMPGQHVVAVVFFEKPKSGSYTLSLVMPNHPKVSIKLEAQR